MDDSASLDELLRLAYALRVEGTVQKVIAASNEPGYMFKSMYCSMLQAQIQGEAKQISRVLNLPCSTKQLVDHPATQEPMLRCF